MESVPYFLAKLESCKAGTFFKSVTTWSVTLPGNEDQSHRVHDDMLTVLDEKHLYHFLNNSTYINDGFRMLADLTKTIHPSNPKNCLRGVKVLGGLEQGITERTDTYMLHI